MNKNKLKKMIASSIAMLLFGGVGLGSAVPKPATSKYPPKEQITKIELTTIERAEPGVYWYQLDNGTFNADFTNYDGSANSLNTPMAGTCNQPYPKVAPFTYEIDLMNYLPKQVEYEGKDIPFTQLANKRLVKVVYVIDRKKTYDPVGVPSILNHGKKAKVVTFSTRVRLTTKTGMGYKNRKYKEYMKRPNKCPKVSMGYLTPLDVTWAGDLIEKKVIDVTPDSQLKVGETKSLKAMIKTVKYDKTNESTDITSTSETRWVSENPAIATIDSNGQVKAKKKGTVKIRAIWKKDKYHISDIATIAVGEALHVSPDDRDSSGSTDTYHDSEFPPDRYKYELDFEVISIDGKTAEKDTSTTTKVKVRRLSFAENRNQAKEAIQRDIDTRKERKRDLENRVSDLESDISYEYRNEEPNYSYISSLRSRISDLRDQMNQLNRQIAHYEKEKNKLLSDEAKNRILTTKLVIRLDGAEQSTTQMITLGENETKTYTFTWNLPNDGTVEGEVNPDQNDFGGSEEQTFDNNSRSTPIHVASHKTVSATDTATAYVEGIVRTINDEKNEQQVYKEKVYTTLKIPEHHRTRRAGFGFDYTVISRYENEDPESTAIGSVNTRSYFQNQVNPLPYKKQTWQSPNNELTLSGHEVELENTNTVGSRNNQTKEWKLPVFYVEEFSGKVFTEKMHVERNFADKLLDGGRKWYTHFDEPDGVYSFHSLVRDAGVNKLNTSITGTVRIDGVILGSRSGNDDFVRRTVTPNNPFPSGVGFNWQGKVSLLTSLRKWYNEWVADPKDRPLAQYEKTFFLTPEKLEEIRKYNKSVDDKYTLGKSVLDVVHIPRTR